MVIGLESSVLFSGVTIIVAVVGSHVRLETRQNEHAKAFSKLESKVDHIIDNGTFVRTEHCGMQEERFDERLNDIRTAIEREFERVHLAQQANQEVNDRRANDHSQELRRLAIAAGIRRD